MAFVHGTASSESPLTDTHVISLPSGIATGDLLLIWFSYAGSSSTFTATGWNRFFGDLNGQLQLFWRLADGSEGSTATFTSSFARSSLHRSFLIKEWPNISAPAVGGFAAADNLNPDTGSLSPSWGTDDDTLWFSVWRGSGVRTVTAYPANYNLLRFSNVHGELLNQMMATSARKLNAASEDPGAYTLATAANLAWQGVTVGLRDVDAPLSFRRRVNVFGVG